MPDDASWVRVLNSCNRAIKILRAKGYDEPYIDEGNMPANWDELNRKHTELWAAVYAPKKITEASKEELAELYRSVTGNPHHDLRIKLVQLKTDIESAAPELEAMYRGIVEATVAAAKNCDINKTLENYDFLRDVSTMMEKRLSSAEFFDQFPNIIGETASIEKLIRETIAEALAENCKCQFVGGE